MKVKGRFKISLVSELLVNKELANLYYLNRLKNPFFFLGICGVVLVSN